MYLIDTVEMSRTLGRYSNMYTDDGRYPRYVATHHQVGITSMVDGLIGKFGAAKGIALLKMVGNYHITCLYVLCGKPQGIIILHAVKKLQLLPGIEPRSQGRESTT